MFDFFADVTVQTVDPFEHTCSMNTDDMVTVPLTRRPRASTAPWECAVCGEEREGRVECGNCGAD